VRTALLSVAGAILLMYSYLAWIDVAFGMRVRRFGGFQSCTWSRWTRVGYRLEDWRLRRANR
jgi:hypothetical protein